MTPISSSLLIHASEKKAPGLNATCSATSPSRAADKRRPSICHPNFWDGPARCESFAYGEPPQEQFSHGLDPCQGYEPFNGAQCYENASAPYGNHPSGPFMSDLSANLAKTVGCLQDVVKQVSFRYSCISNPPFGSMVAPSSPWSIWSRLTKIYSGHRDMDISILCVVLSAYRMPFAVQNDFSYRSAV
jgi:hypothetical protein